MEAPLAVTTGQSIVQLISSTLPINEYMTLRFVTGLLRPRLYFCVPIRDGTPTSTRSSVNI